MLRALLSVSVGQARPALHFCYRLVGLAPAHAWPTPPGGSWPQGEAVGSDAADQLARLLWDLAWAHGRLADLLGEVAAPAHSLPASWQPQTRLLQALAGAADGLAHRCAPVGVGCGICCQPAKACV